MGRVGTALNFLTLDEVLEIHRQIMFTFGGFYTEGDKNLGNSGSLGYILEAIQSSFNGCDLYPTLVRKAAALAWRIITAHVFHDGNKRTGMEICRMMLDINGHTMRIDREVIEIAIHVSTHQITFEKFVEWVKLRTTKIT